MTVPRGPLVLATVLLAAGCPRLAGPEARRVEVLVVAPHPDDEVVMAGGVLARAVAEGRRAAVVLVTSGDKGCGRDGFARLRESLAAARALGLRPDDVHVLGYPDGSLAALSEAPLAPLPRRDERGACVTATGTYPLAGPGPVAEHVKRTGHPAPYTAPALEEDLAELLGRLQPADVYLPHPIDTHPDHASTYTYVRRALDRLGGPPPALHRAVVHAGGCWPAVDCERPCSLTQPHEALPPPLQGYRFGELLPTDAAAKLRLLALYPSQLDGAAVEDDWLAAFARPAEPFAPERLTRGPRGWVRAPAQGVAPVELALALPAEGGVEVPWQGGEPLRLELTGEALRLVRAGAGKPLARWRLPGGGPVALRARLDPRPDDGGLTELSLWSPAGFLGQALLAP